jgi:hypothetical protein
MDYKDKYIKQIRSGLKDLQLYNNILIKYLINILLINTKLTIHLYIITNNYILFPNNHI